MPKIKDTPKILRPREKFLQKGPNALSKSDLLAIVLGSGIKGKNVQKLAQQIVKKFSGNFLNVTIEDLQTIDGIGPAKALQIASAIALVKRYYKEDDSKEVVIKNSKDVLNLTYDLREKKKEYLICLYLNARNVLIKKEIISVGLLDKSLLHPREIFHPAVELNSASIILVHNHPSGDSTPSEKDKEVVKKIAQAGELMGIPVIDFLILSENGEYSFFEELKDQNGSFNYVADGAQATLFDFLEIEKPAYEVSIKKKKNNNNNIMNKPTYIDLFCGAGGFSLGFDKAGFKNIFSIDIENNFCKTYRKNFNNHNLIEKDITKITDNEIKKLVDNKKIDVIIGGPPCQGFSIAGNIGRKFIDDPRNRLFKEFVRIVRIVRPNHFIMENVARLFTHNNKKTRNEIISDFERIGYKVKAKILNSADFGVPQVRKRVIFIGTKTKSEIKFPQKTVNTYVTVKDAIDDLPSLNSGEKSEIPNHVAMNHSTQMLVKMNYINDGGDRYDIPKDIRPKSGDIRKYIKYASDKPAITITGDMRKVFHYSQNRALTVRELARLQSFPDNFIFEGTSISQQQQVGNAVPPLMAETIANSIKNMSQKLDKKNKIHVKITNKFPKINFIGNKEKLANWICDHFPKDAKSIFDAFAGGCSVSYEAKKRGYKVISNDILKINYLLSKALIENNSEVLTKDDIELIFTGKPIKGFMYKNYSEVFFFPEECMELDLYRKNIDNLSNDYKKSLALILLRRAMIRKMPYSRFNINWEKIKQLRNEEWSYKKYKRKRAYHNESFKSHFLKNLDDYNNAIFDNQNNNKAYNEDIFLLLKNISADIIYLDPPYTGTMNNYFGFYGMLDEYIESKKLKPFENNFINKNSSLELFNKLFSNLSNYKYWFLSYNNNSYPSKDELLYIIGKYSKNIEVIEKTHIYKVTGKRNKQKNREYLFIIKNDNFIPNN